MGAYVCAQSFICKVERSKCLSSFCGAPLLHLLRGMIWCFDMRSPDRVWRATPYVVGANCDEGVTCDAHLVALSISPVIQHGLRSSTLFQCTFPILRRRVVRRFYTHLPVKICRSTLLQGLCSAQALLLGFRMASRGLKS